MLEQTEENIRQNFFYFIYGGAGPLHRLRLRPKSTGSATLVALRGFTDYCVFIHAVRLG